MAAIDGFAASDAVARNVCGWRRRIVRVQITHERTELVVSELRFGKTGPLLEDDDRESRRRELLGDDASGGTRSDNREVDHVTRLKAGRRPSLFLHVSLSC